MKKIVAIAIVLFAANADAAYAQSTDQERWNQVIQNLETSRQMMDDSYTPSAPDLFANQQRCGYARIMRDGEAWGNHTYVCSE